MCSLTARFARLLLLSCAALLACQEAKPPPAQAPPLPAAADIDVTATEAERQCSADADCTLTTVDCCGCNALGRQTAVRKDKLPALTERRRAICGTIACAQGMSDDPSCAATRAQCRTGVCTADTAAAAQHGVGVEKIAN